MMNLPELEPRYLSIEPAPLEAEKSRRFFGRRVGGGTAIRGAELPEYLKDPDYGYAEVFGIGDEIRDFTQGWQDYAGVINAFLEDDSNYDVFEEVARSKIGDASDRNSRRVQGRMLERDFEELAIATVIRSRIRRTYPLESSQVAGNETGKGLITSTLVSVSEYNAVNAKYNGIFSNFPSSPALERLQRRMQEFGNAVDNVYKPILKTETTITKKLLEQIDGNPDRAKQLVNSFIEASASEALEDKSFAKFLATQHVVAREGSILSRAMDLVRAGVEKGSIAKEFIDKNTSANNGNNIFAFFSQALTDQGVKVPVSIFMAARFESWTQDLVAGYKGFIGDYLASLTTNVQRCTSQRTEKSWIHPSIGILESAVDRIFGRLHGKYAKGTKNGKGSPDVRVSGNTVLKSSDVLPGVVHEQEVKSRIPVILTRGIDGVVWGSNNSVEGIVRDLVPASRKHDTKFIEEVKQLIESFTKDPYAQGAQLLRETSKRQTKFYRINPVHVRGIPVKAAKSARIIFTLDKDRLGIYSITADHQDYEKAVAGLV